MPATLQTSEYPDVSERMRALSCDRRISFCILPRNFLDAANRSQLLHESNTPTIRKILREADIQETQLEDPGERFAQIDQKAFEWIGPTMFFSAAALSQNPHLLAVSLNVIGNFLTDWFKGVVGQHAVRLSIVSEYTKTTGCFKVDYSGPPEGLARLPAIVKEVANGTKKHK